MLSYPTSRSGCPAGAVRRYPRLLFSAGCTVHHLAPGGVRSSRALTLDISENGVGALVEGSLQVGEAVGIEVPLPDWLLSAVAIVRYTSNVRSGFEFVGLKPEERQHIASLVGTA